MHSPLKFVAALLIAMLSGSSLLSAENITVTGKVVDEFGEPLIGAGVTDKNNPGKGVVTDLDGKFSVSIAGDGFLEFSYIGYDSKVEAVSGRKTIEVKLQPKSNTLDEVVVIGYGTSKKADLTGSVATVDLDAVAESSSANISQSLQGRIAGVEISSQSGEPGEAGTIQIRGSRSISAGNQPLIVVDGVMDAVEDLGELNPADIASISVLKDVSSTAIYGSRGANGVILVSTVPKKEKQVGTFSVKFNAKAGVSMVAGSIDIMDAAEYATWRNMVYAVNSAASGTSWNWEAADRHHYYPDPSALGKGTDWIKTLTRPAAYQDYYASLSGRAANVNYFISAGYHNEKGVVIGSGSEKITARASFDVKLKPWMQIGVRSIFSDQRVDVTQAAISGTNSNAAIYLSPILKPEDTWNQFGDDESYGGAIFNNPYLTATNAQKWKRRNSFTLNPWLKADIGKYFKLEAKFSYNHYNTHDFQYSPSTLPVAAYNKTGGTAMRGDFLKQTLEGEATFNYRQNIGKNTLEAMAGFSAEWRKTDNMAVTGSGYLDDNVTYENMRGILYTDNLNPNSYQIIETKMSFFGRFNYSWDRRYYVTLTLRGDGASNFAANKKWGFFPALAFRWSIVNEKWFKQAWWLNDLSLRASIGRSGNDAISNYMSLATLSSGKTRWTFGESRQVAYTPAKLANSNLSWETTDAVNLGLNFEAFRSRLGIEVDSYLSVTRDLLLSMRTSQVTGYDTYFNNMGSTRNAGIEVTITSKNFVLKNFKWNTSLTIAHNSQIVLDCGEGDAVVPPYMNPRNSSQYLYGYRKGYPVNSLWGYQFEGIWKTEAEYERNKSTRAWTSGYAATAFKDNIGRSKYADLNHNGLLEEGDVVYLGCSDPIVHGGIQNDFVLFKRLKIGIYFAYSIGGQMYNLSELWLASGDSGYNHYRYMLSAWTPDNPESNIPAAYRKDYYGCTRFVHDASYLRLKTVSIDYDIPLPRSFAKVVKKIVIGVTGENLWLLKAYNGFDPDVNTSSSVYRLDNGSLPRPRTIIGKINFQF